MVLVYHFDLLAFSGGFIGVDVFFVISGYLITSIIREEIEKGEFTFTKFYARRARRILPALITTLISTIAIGWVLLLPSDFTLLAKQVATAVAGVSNIFFFFNTGYFDRANETMPLLHTWSLGVEEQFYVIWPALLWLATRWSKSPVPVVATLVAITVLSFGLALYQVPRDAMAAFYLLPSRAWELALGAGLTLFPAISRRWVAELMRIAGLILIL